MSLYWILIGGAAVAVGLAMIELLLGGRGERGESVRSWDDFDAVAAERGLTVDERARLRRWVEKAGLRRPQEVLLLPDTFERFVADEVGALGAPTSFAAPGEDSPRERSLAELRAVRRKLELRPVQKGAALISSRELEVGLWVSTRGGTETDRGDWRVMAVDDEKVLLRPRGAAGASSAVREESDESASNASRPPTRTPITGEYSVAELLRDEIWVILWRGVDAIYRFRAPVLKRGLPEEGDMLVGHGHSIIRIQNRRDPRVDARFEVEIHRSDAANGEEPTVGTTINLSAGGTSILSPVEIDKGARLRLLLADERAPLREASAEVVRKGRVVGADEGEAHHYLHCRFVELGPDARRDLAAWIERMDAGASRAGARRAS